MKIFFIILLIFINSACIPVAKKQQEEKPPQIPENRRDGAGEQAVPGEKIKEDIDNLELQTHS